jgi:hypothetical protein
MMADRDRDQGKMTTRGCVFADLATAENARVKALIATIIRPLWLSVLIHERRHLMCKIVSAAGDDVRHRPDHAGRQSRFW